MANHITKPKSTCAFRYYNRQLTNPLHRGEVEADSRPFTAQDREGICREAAQSQKGSEEEPAMEVQAEEGPGHPELVPLQGEDST